MSNRSSNFHQRQVLVENISTADGAGLGAVAVVDQLDVCAIVSSEVPRNGVTGGAAQIDIGYRHGKNIVIVGGVVADDADGRTIQLHAAAVVRQCVIGDRVAGAAEKREGEVKTADGNIFDVYAGNRTAGEPNIDADRVR